MNVEHYTPGNIIELARNCLGTIELDVASCEAANEIVQADRYFDKEDNGLIHPWTAKTIWMNHPYGRGSNNLWIDKLFHEWYRGNFGEALVLTNVSTASGYGQKLLHYPTCFLNKRIKFLDENMNLQTSPRYDNMITYFGNDEYTFKYYFEELGVIK